MSNKIPDQLNPMPTRLSRRDLLGFAAKGAASVVVSQSVLLSCASGAVSATDTVSTGGATKTPTTGSSAFGFTSALTEGPYFVDEMLNRFQNRTEAVTRAGSDRAPLSLAV